MSWLKTYMQNLYMSAHRLNAANTLGLIEGGAQTQLLDIGCHDGAWTVEMGSRLGTREIHGLEILPEAISQAEKRGVKVVAADIETKWPYPDGKFDLVHGSFVIEHVNSVDHFVSEIRRVLKPGGRVVVSTENGSSWHNIGAAVLGWQTFSSSCSSTKVKGLGNPLALHRGGGTTAPSQTHKVIFNYLGFKEIFEAYGFKDIVIKGAGYYPLPSMFGAMDPRHAHFLALRAVKGEMQ